MLRKGMTVGILVAVMLLATVGVVVAEKPTTFTLEFNGAQFQWRGWLPYPAEDAAWSNVIDYGLTPADDAFTLTGNVLHTSFAFSPPALDVVGASTNYVLKSGLWIEREGTIDYRMPPDYYCESCDFLYVSYWRGYMNFSGTPSQETFERSVVYQWVYVYLPQDDSSVTDAIQYAQWDETMGAWLVGYSVYIYDAHPADINLAWTFHFAEPVPASNYNALNL